MITAAFRNLTTRSLVATALVAFAGDSFAAAPRRVRDALTGEALHAFDRGAVLFADGDFSGARAELERAHALSHEPRVLYNVAVCEKSLRRYARAIASLRASLDEGKATLPRDYREKVDDTIKALEPFVTTLTIESDQDGATVFVDDENVGTTPLAAPIAAEVGEHTIAVRKTGYLDMPVRIALTSGQPKAVRLALDPAVKRGTVHVDATTKVGAGVGDGLRARVLVDGVEVGDTPWTGTVDAGRHTFTVRAAELVTGQKMDDVAFGGDTRIAFTMEPEKHEARLRVVTDDDETSIVLDGKVVAHGQFDGAVASGEHQLRITRAGSEPRVSDFVVRDNEVRSLNVTLESKRSGVPAWLWVAGGIVVASGVTTAVVFATRQTSYDGSAPGTLAPGFVPASFRIRGL